jgi:hypothetical protein
MHERGSGGVVFLIPKALRLQNPFALCCSLIELFLNHISSYWSLSVKARKEEALRYENPMGRRKRGE